jgi:hypothetical protein
MLLHHSHYLTRHDLGISTFHNLSLSTEKLSNLGDFFAFIASLRWPTNFSLSISTAKASTVVFPLTRQSNVIDISAYTVFFCEMLLVQTNVCEDKSKKIILFARWGISEKFTYFVVQEYSKLFLAVDQHSGLQCIGEMNFKTKLIYHVILWRLAESRS